MGISKTLTTASLMCLLADAAPGQWSTSSLSQGRCWVASASVGTKAFFAGGFTQNPTGFSPVVDIYDVPSGTWSIALLAQPTVLMAATAVGDKVFFAGGQDGNDPGTGVPLATAVVYIYDDSTGGWSTGSLSEARWGICAVTVGQKAVFAGGCFSSGSNFVYSDTVDIYDSVSGSWTVGNLSLPRASIGGASSGTLAMFGGGQAQMGPSPRVDIFDSSTGMWSTDWLPTARGNVGTTAVGDLILFRAGECCNAGIVPVDIFDTSTQQWRLELLLSAPRFNVGATTVGDLAVFAGGQDGSWSSDVVDIYDARTDAWHTATLSLARSPAATSVEGLALFGGGTHAAGGTTNCVAEVDIYDPAVGTSYCAPAIPNSNAVPGVVTATAYFEDLHLIASQLPVGQLGYFLTSQTQGFFNPPGSSGFICLGRAIGRFNRPGEVGQGPLFSIEVDLTSLPVNPPQAVMPGDTWNFQAWYRDIGNTNNFTDAVSVVFQ